MFKNIKLFVAAFKAGKANIDRIDKSVVKYTKITGPLEAIRADKHLKIKTRDCYKFLREYNPRMNPLEAHTIARQMAWQITDPDAWDQYLTELAKRAAETD